jgi:hypothetical protein
MLRQPSVKTAARMGHTRSEKIGAGVGLLFGLAVVATARFDWVFFYFLSAPMRLADAAQDLARTPSWIIYPLTCAYYAVGGWVVGRAWAIRHSRILLLAVVLALVVGHLTLAAAGSQHFFREFFAGVRAGRTLPPVAPHEGSSPPPAR